MGFQSTTNPGSHRAQWLRGQVLETSSPWFELQCCHFLHNDQRPVTSLVFLQWVKFEQEQWRRDNMRDKNRASHPVSLSNVKCFIFSKYYSDIFKNPMKPTTLEKISDWKLKHQSLYWKSQWSFQVSELIA